MVLEVALIWVRCFFCLHSCWCFLFKRWYLKGGYEWWSGGCWAELWIKENHLNQISRGPRFNIWNILMSSNTKHQGECIICIAYPIFDQKHPNQNDIFLYILISRLKLLHPRSELFSSQGLSVSEDLLLKFDLARSSIKYSSKHNFVSIQFKIQFGIKYNSKYNFVSNTTQIQFWK